MMACLPAGKKKDFGLLRVEKQVIALTVDGYSSEQIAKRIGISESVLECTSQAFTKSFASRINSN